MKNDLTRYYQYRAQLGTGDLLTYDTEGIISSMIKFWSPGANHAGMVLHLPEYAGKECRRWTLEATSHGPRMAFLSDLLEGIHGKCYWHQLNPEITEEQRNAAGCWALEQQGVVKYDFKGVLQYPFKMVSADLNRLLCSEYVQFSWVKGEIIKAIKKVYNPSELGGLKVTLPPVLLVESEPTVYENITVSP